MLLIHMPLWDPTTIDKIRRGYYSAVYFNRTKEILLQEKNLSIATMQIFQKKDAVTLCGIQHVIELLKLGTGYFDRDKWISKWETLKVKTLSDGDRIKPNEPVMHITGPYAYFAHLESVYLGILARQTRIATNANLVVKAAKGKQILFFADRFDYFLNQEMDGYAAHIGGVANVCTFAQGNLINETPVGTIPHALIAINQGQTPVATEQFSKHFPNNPLVALVDFDNDCVTTSLQATKTFGKKLWGVRLDTSETMIDKSLQGLSEKNNELHGVNPTLVKQVRTALDKQGFSDVKIIVSGGFTSKKIEAFKKAHVPVDVYAVGSAMLDGKYDFTADIVSVAGKEIAKQGRNLQKNDRLKIAK